MRKKDILLSDCEACMDWKDNIITKNKMDSIKNFEEKKLVAEKVAEKVKDGQVIGFGSGSTSYLATIAIADKIKRESIHITAIPTSLEIKLLCGYLKIPITTLNNKKPDWSFDGADEVDNNNWLIKGMGGALFKEKLNIVNSPITYILIDKSKRVNKLGEKCKVPVECFPEAISYVKEELTKIGATEIEIREAVSKAGPVITENGNVILDVKFDNITEGLEKKIKSIPGVIESGLFISYKVEIIE